MKNKNNEQLLKEIKILKARISEFEKNEAGRLSAEQAGRRTEEALRESEEKFRTLVTNTEEIIYMIAKDGTILLSEGKGLAKLGLKPGEIVGQSVFELYKDYPDLLADMKKAFSGETITTEGEVGGIHFRSWYTPHINNDGEIVGLMGLSINITEQKQAETALQQLVTEITVLNTLGQQVNSNLTIDQVVQSALDGIVEPIKPDLALLFLRDNDKLFVCGIKYENPKFGHKNTPVHKVGECMCGLASRNKKALYSRNIKKDPRCTWDEYKKAGLISFAALPLLSGDEVIGVLGIGSAVERDFSEQANFLETVSNQISIGLQNAILYEQLMDHTAKLELEIVERKRTESELQDAKERYDFATAAGKVGTWDWNPVTGELLWNDEVYRLLGFSPGEVTPTYPLFLDLVHPEDREVLEKAVQKALNENVPYNLDCRIIAKDGKEHVCFAAGKVTFDDDGKPIRMLGIFHDISKRKQAEAELQLRVHQLRLIYDSTGDSLCYMKVEPGPHYRFITVNSAFLKATGLTSEQIIGKTINEIIPEPSLKAALFNYKKAIQEKRILFWEETSQYPTGMITGIVSIAPVFDHKGNCTHLVGSVHDITERKRAEQELKDSENLLRESQKVANLGSYVLDIQSGTWKSSTTLDDVFGIDNTHNKDIEGWLQIVHPDERDMMRDYFATSVLTNHEPFNKEYRIKRISNDKECWVHGLGELEFNDDGNPIKMIGTIQDITGRKKSEEEIRKLFYSVEQSPAIVMISNTNGAIEYVNPKFEEVTGYTACEVIGKNPRILKSGETSAKEYEVLWKTIKTGGEWHGEFHNRKKNGELYWESSSISAIKDSTGKITNFVAIKEDISERKAIEQRLQESHNRLRSLAERLQTIREQERAAVAREIHDDLGQSLTALKMDISWMKNTPGMDEDAKTAKFDMMLDLTNSSLQSVKRIAAELRPGIIDDLGLAAAIEWQAAEFQKRFKIKCKVSINKSGIIIKDEISIAVFRIFQESLTNIARHSGATKVRINLNFYDNSKLIMEIADNGVGIDEEQANNPKSFGLIGMRERVHFLKGEIEITGEYGKGTTVRLSVDY